MDSENSSTKKVIKTANGEEILEIYSKKVGRNIRVTISPVLSEEERLKRIIGLSNSSATG